MFCTWRPSVIVFPTLVGVFPLVINLLRGLFGLPHARGGVSKKVTKKVYKSRSSPRSWGCFSIAVPNGIIHQVFPTLVGVFLGNS